MRTKRFKNIVLFLLITFLVSGFSVNINAEPYLLMKIMVMMFTLKMMQTF